MRRLLIFGLFIILISTLQTSVFAQGEVGIGTVTPQEKLDVNGAVIIRSESTAGTTNPGTIQYNTTEGWHEGWLSSGEWRKQENDYDYLAGNYSSTGCGLSVINTFGTYFTTTTALSPFYSLTQDKKIQYLFTAAELTAAGYCSGEITSIGFNVISIGTTPTYNSFTIKVKNTATTTLTTTFETGAVIAFGPSTITIVAGTNTFNFTTPYTWDGTSNLLFELCYDNTVTGTNPTIESSTVGLGYNATTYRNATSAFGGCSFLATATPSTQRPVIKIGGSTFGTFLTANNYNKFNKGIVIGSPLIPAPYEFHGPGTITGEAIYDDNTLISDYVFDHYFDGAIKEEDAKLHAEYEMYSLEEMIKFMIDERHLPTIEGRKEWIQNGKFSVGALSTQLWTTTETQSLYLIELNSRLDTLEEQLDKLNSEK